MAQKKCKQCKTDIDEKATKCPNCKGDQRNFMERHPILMAIFAIIGVIAFFNMIGGQKDKGTWNGSASKNQTVANQVAVPAMEVDTLTFIGDFDKNQLAAEEKYKDKKVRMTAYIKNISEDIGGAFFLSLTPSSDKYYFGTTVKCTFQNKSALTSLENGQQITVEGIVKEQSLGIISVHDCVTK
jgi:hypothetical protein